MTWAHGLKGVPVMASAEETASSKGDGPRNAQQECTTTFWTPR